MRPAGRVLNAGAALLPGALVVVLGFQAGGFYPVSWSVTAAVAAVLLALRIVLAEHPFAGLSRSAGVIMAALALLGVWMLVSASWSHAPARALFTFERLLAYGLVFALLASLPGGAGRAAWTLRGVALGIGVICVAALVPRFAPDIYTVDIGSPQTRLTWPITYWNGLGMLAGVGLILGFHLTASATEPRWVRVLGVALMPPAACALYLTFSRGAIAATVVGLVAYVLVGRPRAGLTALLSAGVATTVAFLQTYDAGVLARDGGTVGLTEAHRIGTIVLLCCLGGMAVRAVLLPLDARLARASVGARTHRAGVVALIAGVVVGVAVLLNAGAVGWSRDQADRFLNAPTPTTPDLRDRLAIVSNGGRTGHWRVSIDGFERHPWGGTGAGTFDIQWDRYRRERRDVINAHSLYIETLGELGIVGIVLLVVAIGGLLVTLAWRARGPERGVAAAAFAAILVWAGHAGVDWDWQLSAITVWVFGLGAAVLARPGPPTGRPVPRPARLILALGVLVLAIAPVRIAQSQVDVVRAVDAYFAGDCPKAVDAALGSLEAVPSRTEPREILAYCDVRAGQDRLAVRAIDAAVAADPDNWEVVYGQALVYGAVGRDPRPAAARALRLNPFEARTVAAARAFDTRSRSAWKRRALRLRLRIH